MAFSSSRNETSDIAFKIVRPIGVVGTTSSRGGWKLELNIVSWNDKPPRYDLRIWSPDHGKMGKGVTFSRGDLAVLSALLRRELERREENSDQNVGEKTA